MSAFFEISGFYNLYQTAFVVGFCCDYEGGLQKLHNIIFYTLNRINLLAEDPTPFDGILNGKQKPVGIVLIVAGVLLVYIAIKMLLGYKFFPDRDQTIIDEKKYTPAKAKVIKKIVSEMPSFNGGAPGEYVEWEISYDVGGVVYTQIIPDDEYKENDEIDIMYSPDNPQEYYVDKTVEIPKKEKNEKQPVSKGGIAMIILAVMLLSVGIVLVVS